MNIYSPGRYRRSWLYKYTSIIHIHKKRTRYHIASHCRFLLSYCIHPRIRLWVPLIPTLIIPSSILISVLGMEPMDLAGSFVVDFVDTLVSDSVDTYGSVGILDWLILLVISVVDFVHTIVVDYAAGFEFPYTYLGTSIFTRLATFKTNPQFLANTGSHHEPSCKSRSLAYLQSCFLGVWVGSSKLFQSFLSSISNLYFLVMVALNNYIPSSS